MEKESLRMSPRSRKELRTTHTKGYRVVSAQKVSTTYVPALAGVIFFTAAPPLKGLTGA